MTAEHITPPPAGKPPGDDDHRGDDGPTTWERVDLGPYLRGEIERPEPSIGIARSDGLRLIYPGREHAVIGATECGKSWLALASVAAELDFGRQVVYMHFEEADPGSTVERLRLLGVDPAVMAERLCFVGPARPVRVEWLAPLLDIAPSLVVLDGANEATSLHGGGTTKVEDWSDVRRRIISPFVRTGAAVLVCDHIPMGADATRLDSYGTVHKGAVVDGARIMLENRAPMGRGMRGVSHVFITKDRPGHLRAHGKPSKTPGKPWIGTLIVDDSQTFGPDFALKFFAPKDDETAPATDPADKLAATVHEVISALPDHTVASTRLLLAELRNAGHEYRDAEVRDAVDDLIVAGRLTEVPGKRGARGYQATVTASDKPDEHSSESGPRPATASRVPPTGGGTQWDAVADVTASDCRDAVGRSGTQSVTEWTWTRPRNRKGQGRAQPWETKTATVAFGTFADEQCATVLKRLKAGLEPCRNTPRLRHRQVCVDGSAVKAWFCIDCAPTEVWEVIPADDAARLREGAKS